MCTFSRDNVVSDSAPDVPCTGTSPEQHTEVEQARDISQLRATVFMLLCATEAVRKSGHVETVPLPTSEADTLESPFYGVSAGRI